MPTAPMVMERAPRRAACGCSSPVSSRLNNATAGAPAKSPANILGLRAELRWESSATKAPASTTLSASSSQGLMSGEY